MTLLDSAVRNNELEDVISDFSSTNNPNPQEFTTQSLNDYNDHHPADQLFPNETVHSGSFDLY